MKRNVQKYYPPSELKGGWRVLENPKKIITLGGIDPRKLELAWESNLGARAESKSQEQKHLNPYDDRVIPEASSSSVIVIRHGYIVGEWYQNTDETTRWNIHSCTKSFTGTAYGILFQDGKEKKLPSDKKIDLNSYAYSYIPEGHPLTDQRKERIRISHLLTMTSCIKGENAGVFGLQPPNGFGPFELSLGYCPTVDETSVSDLWEEPGEKWDYSDPAFAHLALIFYNATGMELEDYLRERVFDPIGLENYSWDSIGGNNGSIGPHTFPNSGIHITARDLARFGYLTLNQGAWTGHQLVPEPWMEIATRTSQSLNKNYGYTWWVNTYGSLWPGVPRDTFAAMGFKSNKCYVIPSLDLVIVRIGDGPWPWVEGPFLRRIVSSII